MVRERTGYPPSCAGAKRIKSLTLHTHGCPRASLRGCSSLLLFLSVVGYEQGHSQKKAFRGWGSSIDFERIYYFMHFSSYYIHLLRLNLETPRYGHG